MKRKITFTENELEYLRSVYSDEIDQTIKYVNLFEIPKQKYDATGETKLTKASPDMRDIKEPASKKNKDIKTKAGDKKKSMVKSVGIESTHVEQIVPTKPKAKRYYTTKSHRKGVTLSNWNKPLKKPSSPLNGGV